MNNRTLFYVLIFVLVFFLLIDFVSLFFVKRNFSIEYYNTEIVMDFSDVATMTTFSGLRFKDVKKRDDFLKNYNQNSRKTFEDYFSTISKEIGKTVRVVDVESTVTSRDTLLEITERVTLSGLVHKRSDGKFQAGLGKMKLSNLANSQLKVRIPREAKLEFVDPTPTSVNRNVLIWEESDMLYFPDIVFGKGAEK
ncbi:DUF4897 domain-containing protein [Fervidobacterium thailandense]|uniref:DUF4897 domain-containing protein n=1 Tax=Fervidobacterium thailandense TaxID=1008305 RepID=A0A1E3G6V8_9BACT|nr:DUF4897 domain-containing protein [Fervidobacterium thailandense]ODN31348.1 hypothetical protein A4H02_00875 [Fervidobacterium thailandense]